MAGTRGILNKYKELRKNWPIITQSVQTGFLTGTADVIAQTLVEKKALLETDVGRTCRFFFFGTLFVGPNVTTWHRFLSRRLGDTGKVTSLKKVAIDQILFVPLFQAVAIITKNNFDNRDWAFMKEQLRLKYTDILVANYKVWPAVLLANSYFVPLNQQALVFQTASLLWYVYFSWKTEQGLDQHKKE